MGSKLYLTNVLRQNAFKHHTHTHTLQKLLLLFFCCRYTPVCSCEKYLSVFPIEV